MKVGVSYFVNALPLALQLEALPEVEVVYATPARLSYMLARGELDSALTSSSEFFRGDYSIVQGYSISSRNSGADAVLYSKVPLEQVSSVALDAASQSTNYLLQLLLARRLPGRPLKFEVRPGEPLRSLQDLDACLLIGDQALQDYPSPLYRYDLTAMWFEDTGLPMVYSIWLVRREAEEQARTVLAGVGDACRVTLDAVAAAAAEQRGLSHDRTAHYLTSCLEFGWSAEHAESLRLFGDLIRELGFASHFENREIRQV